MAETTRTNQRHSEQLHLLGHHRSERLGVCVLEPCMGQIRASDTAFLLCISLGLRLGSGRSKAREMPPRTYGCGETLRRLRRTCKAVDGTYTNLSPRTLRETRPIRWTVVTSCFSHESSMHILFNGFTYYFMAPLVLSILGNVGFLGLYLGGMPPPFWSHCADAHPSDRCRRHHI